MILYIGIDPPPGVYHYPVIRTERIDSPELVQALTLPFTHILFTSKNAVRHWPGAIQNPIAIGEATAAEVRTRGGAPLVAPDATQEGVMALLDTLDLGFLLYPHSKRARIHLRGYLRLRKIPHFAFDLYDTVFQKPDPVPDLADFDEIVFTSPSTIEGFSEIFSDLPEHIALTPIGPVTKKALEQYFFPRIC